MSRGINFNLVRSLRLSSVFSLSLVVLVGVLLYAAVTILPVNAASLSYTATDDGLITYSAGFGLSGINDGITSNDFDMHMLNAAPSNVVTMTFASPVTIASTEFYNRQLCCRDRIAEAELIYKDNSGATIYTHTFSGVNDNTLSEYYGEFVTIVDPAGPLVDVKTVELTNIQSAGLNLREIVFNDTLNSFSSLYDAYVASQQAGFEEGTYHFNINGNQFISYVDDNGYVLAVSGEGTTTETAPGYTATDDLFLRADMTLPSATIAAMQPTELRMSDEEDTTIDVTTSNSTVITNFRNYKVLSLGVGGTAWSGTGVANLGTNSGADRDLNEGVYHPSGDSGSMHWIPELGVENAVASGSGTDDLHLWARDTTPNIGPGGVTGNLGLWLKAETGTNNTGNGQLVTTWADQSPFGNDFTALAGDQPTITDDAVNFNRGLTFADDDFLSRTGQIYNPDASHHIYVVTNADTPSNVGWSQLAAAPAGTGKLLNFGGAYANNNTGSTTAPGLGLSSSPRIISAGQNGLNVTTYQDGQTVNTGSHNGGTGAIINSNIGGGDFGGHSIEGDILEFIAYTDENATSGDQAKIESYLALKYGITLDQTAATNYVASDGSTTMWAAADNAGYDNDIFGVGRDDDSQLGQVKSKSVSSDAIVTIEAVGEGTNAANAFTDIANLEFLTIANNNDDNGTIETQTTELDTATYTNRLDREWKVDEEGDVGTVDLDFDLTGLGILSTSDIYLLIDDDSDFSTDLTQQIAASSWDGTTATFDGMTLADGEFFTLASAPKPAPGGISTGLELWLKANEGATVSLWSDQSGSGNDAAQATPADQPSITANAHNFNPTVTFTQTQLKSTPAEEFSTGLYQHYDIPSAAFAEAELAASQVFVVGQKTADNQTYLEYTVGFDRGFSGSQYGDQFDVYDSFAENSADKTDGTGTLDELVIHRGYNYGATPNLSSNVAIGRGTHGFEHLEGDISEIVFVSDNISPAEVQQIESYLALKYGITLDSSVEDYLDSNGTSVFENGSFNEFAEVLGDTQNPAGANPVLIDASTTYIPDVTGPHTFIYGADVVSGTAGASIGTTAGGTDVYTPTTPERLTPTNLQNTVTVTLTAGTTYHIITWSGGSSSAQNMQFSIGGPWHDVFGIANDSGSDLDQQISKSVNDGAIVTISTNTDFTGANGTHTSLSDGQFLVIGNNGDQTANQSTELPVTTVNTRTAREWRVENTGSVGAVNLKFDGFDESWALYIDDDGAFGPGSTMTGQLDANGEITGVTLTDDSYFTLASFQVSPGGVGDELGLWLKADAGLDEADGTSIDTWLDQSNNSNDATEATNQPDFRNNANDNINFNPVVDFNGSNDQLVLDDPALFPSGSGARSYFAVGLPDTGSLTNNHPVIDHGNGLQGRSNLTLSDTSVSTATGESNYIGTHSISTPYIGTTTYAAGGALNTYDFRANGIVLSPSGASDTFTPNTINTNAYIGRLTNSPSTGLHYGGTIAEVVTYNGDLGANPTDRQQIESYLGLKYGITLDQSTATDYLASDGSTTAWTATDNTGFDNDIFGIGRDDTTELGQVKSKSVNSDSIVAIEAVGEGTNAVNAFTDIADLEFLTIANDNDDDGVIETQTTELDTGTYDNRLDREWKVDEQGDVGTVDLDFDLSGLGYVAGDTITLLVNTSSSFSGGTTQAITATSWDGTTATFDGVALADADYFTIAAELEPRTGPGGVDAGLGLWLKANDGSSCTTDSCAVNTWTDQSLNGFIGTTGSAKPLYEENIFNFNPVISNTGGGARQQVTVPLSGLDESAFTRFIALEYETPSTGFGVFEWFQSGMYTHFPYYTDKGFNNRRPANRVDPELVAGQPAVHTWYDTGTQGGQRNLGRELAPFTGGSKGAINGNLRIVEPYVLPSTNQGEYILFDRDLSTTEKLQVESYLALKYGMTIDQTTATNYLMSDGTTATWDSSVDANYKYDIAGIGQDDASELDQRVSRSINDDALVTIATTNDYGSSNADASRTSLGDSNFLTWSNNNALNTVWTTTGAPSVEREILPRSWQVQETGAVGAVYVSVPDDSAGGVALPSENVSVYLLIDDDGDFTSGSSEVQMTLNGTVWEVPAGVDFTDGDYFTIAMDATDPTQPDVTINQAPTQADPTNTNPITFDIVFTEGVDVSSFTSADIDFTGSTAGGITVDSLFEIAPNDGTRFTLIVSATSDGDIVASIPAGAVSEPSGNTNTSSSSTDNVVELDTTPPPAPTVTAPTPSSTVTSPTLTTGTCTTGAANGTASFTTIAAGALNPDPTVVNLDANGNFSTTLLWQASADGNTYSLEVTCTDEAGNTGPTSSVPSLTVDLTQPGVSVEQAPTQADPTNINSAQYLVTFSEPIDPATFALSDITLTGTTGTVTAGSLTTIDNQFWSFEVTGMTSGDTVVATIAAGQVDDLASNSNLASVSGDNAVTYDASPPTTPPAPDLTDTSDTGVTDSDDVTANNSPTFDVQCDQAGSDVALYSDVPSANTLIGVHTCLGAGAEQVNVSPSIADGVHSISYTLTDVAGNTSAHSPQLAVTIDTVAPPAAVNSPTLSDPVQVYPNIDINVECESIGDVITVTGSSINPDPTTFTCPATGSTDVPVVLSTGGAVSLSITATDIAGNESTTTPLEFTAGTADDNDGDGTSNDDENAAPNGDGNGDGIPDYTQGSVASRPNPVNGAHVTLEASGGCSFVNDYAVVAESSLVVQDENFEYPVGLNDFQLACENPGDSAEVTFYYDQVYDISIWTFKKFDDNGSVYSDITDIATFGVADVNGTDVTTITYTVTDGGATDVDGIADGVINDPAGPAVQADDLAETGQGTRTLVLAGSVIALTAIGVSRAKVRTKARG